MTKNYFEYAVALLVIPLVRSQFRITGDSTRQLATKAWNSQWDCLLLGAMFDLDILWNLQSDVPAEKISSETELIIINWHLSGIVARNEHTLTPEDSQWLRDNYQSARVLVKERGFQTAVHALAAFHWHPTPTIRLALIWSGIEALFGVDSEVVFRVSLYTARFLCPGDTSERSKLFATVKRLYKQRSAAVHGSKIKGDVSLAVQEPADLLRRLVKRCAEMRALPTVDSLAP